jgi:hypothetical protein
MLIPYVVRNQLIVDLTVKMLSPRLLTTESVVQIRAGEIDSPSIRTGYFFILQGISSF